MQETTMEEPSSQPLPASADMELHPFDSSLPQPSSDSGNNTKGSNLTWSTILKLISVGFSYFFAGANDSSLGALTPYILRTYGVGTQYIALIYASTFFGWIVAAISNSFVNQFLELGAILALEAAVQLSAMVLRFWNPPFALFVVTFFIQALGMGYQDSHGNTFVAGLKGGHRWLGMIHAMYALGSLVSPFVATAMADQLNGSTGLGSRWMMFYLFLDGTGSVNLLAVLLTFRRSLKIHASTNVTATGQSASRSKMATKDIFETLKRTPVYLISLFYFVEMGVGTTAGGWVVEYLVSVRHGKLPDVGYVPSGLWGKSCLESARCTCRTDKYTRWHFLRSRASCGADL
jgi:fucose permease